MTFMTFDDLDEHLKPIKKEKPKAKNKSKMKAKKARNDLERLSTKAEPTRSPKSINVNVHLFGPSVQRDSPSFLPYDTSKLLYYR